MIGQCLFKSRFKSNQPYISYTLTVLVNINVLHNHETHFFAFVCLCFFFTVFFFGLLFCRPVIVKFSISIEKTGVFFA